MALCLTILNLLPNQKTYTSKGFWCMGVAFAPEILLIKEIFGQMLRPSWFEVDRPKDGKGDTKCFYGNTN